MFATFSAPLPASRPGLAQGTAGSLLRPALAIAAALLAMTALLGLRFGLYAATHHELPVILHLFEQNR